MAQSVELFEADRAIHECGVFGVFTNDPEARIATTVYRGIRAIQNRGEDGAGIAIFNGSQMQILKDTGLVSEVFAEGYTLYGLDDQAAGPAAIGHVRYGTVKKQENSDGFDYVHPFGGERWNFALCQNGTLNGIEELAAGHGIAVEGNQSDTALLTQLVDRYAAFYGDMAEGLKNLLPQVDGAYSLTIAEPDRLTVVRDPNGFRPLFLGKLPGDGGYVVGSEMAAILQAGGVVEREVEPGEIIVIDKDGPHPDSLGMQVNHTTCAFEWVYIARHEGKISGRAVSGARKAMGEKLAEVAPVEADAVIGVPNSGLHAALGYANKSGIPLSFGIMKDQYTTRSFIQADQELRELMAELKMVIDPEEVAGKRLVIVDDSIVRGTTMRVLVRALRLAGATEVHVRIPSPPYKYPCYFGVDTGDRDKLLANNYDLEGMTEYIGADSLAFNTVENLKSSIAPKVGGLCVGCMTGEYPEPYGPDGRRKESGISAGRTLLPIMVIS